MFKLWLTLAVFKVQLWQKYSLL